MKWEQWKVTGSNISVNLNICKNVDVCNGTHMCCLQKRYVDNFRLAKQAQGSSHLADHSS